MGFYLNDKKNKYTNGELSRHRYNHNMERRTIQFTAEGFRSQEIEIAPDIPMQSLSKRYAVIKEEVSYFSNIKYLQS